MYYCCLEAIQNATKHGGPGVHVSVAPAEEDGHLAFRVVDDGPGFAGRQVRGLGLQSMDDRLGALGGRLTIATAPRARHHDLRRGSPATGCAGATPGVASGTALGPPFSALSMYATEFESPPTSCALSVSLRSR